MSRTTCAILGSFLRTRNSTFSGREQKTVFDAAGNKLLISGLEFPLSDFWAGNPNNFRSAHPNGIFFSLAAPHIHTPDQDHQPHTPPPHTATTPKGVCSSNLIVHEAQSHRSTLCFLAQSTTCLIVHYYWRTIPHPTKLAVDAHLGGNVNHHAAISIEIDRRIRNAWCSFRKYSLELSDQPSAPSSSRSGC